MADTICVHKTQLDWISYGAKPPLKKIFLGIFTQTEMAYIYLYLFVIIFKKIIIRPWSGPRLCVVVFPLQNYKLCILRSLCVKCKTIFVKIAANFSVFFHFTQKEELMMRVYSVWRCVTVILQVFLLYFNLFGYFTSLYLPLQESSCGQFFLLHAWLPFRIPNGRFIQGRQCILS